MHLAPAAQPTQRHVQPRTGRSVGFRPRAVANVAQTAVAPPQVAQDATSNIVAVPGGLSEGQRRKLELQAQAAALLEAENSWWRDAPDAPANLLTASTPAEYKRLITGAARDQLVVVDYLKPGCAGCRRLYPKLLQLAGSNPDALFIKVNVELPEMQALAQGMQVAQLPWFHLFRGGDLVASFSANLTTVSVLRAEIAAAKACTDPGCTVY